MIYTATAKLITGQAAPTIRIDAESAERALHLAKVEYWTNFSCYIVVAESTVGVVLAAQQTVPCARCYGAHYPGIVCNY